MPELIDVGCWDGDSEGIWGWIWMEDNEKMIIIIIKGKSQHKAIHSTMLNNLKLQQNSLSKVLVQLWLDIQHFWYFHIWNLGIF